MVIVG